MAARDYCRGWSTGSAVRDRHQPGHRDPAAGAVRADAVRRPGLGAEGWAAAGPNRPDRRCRDAEPGSGFQLAWARAYAAAARSPGQDLAVLRGLAGRTGRPRRAADRHRAALDACCRRWSPAGAADPDEIDAELARDRTASGERQAALARALIPTAANKAAVWQRLVSGRPAAELAAAVAAARLPALVAGGADRAVRERVLRRRRAGLGDPGQRAGAGVRSGWRTRRTR